MKRFVIDGNKVVLTNTETADKVDEVTFEANEVYSIDIAVTKGSGKTRSVGTRSTVYRRNVEETYMLKMKASRALLSEVDSRFPVFPFSLRFVLDEEVRCRAISGTSARMGIVECMNHYLLEEYPVINTADGCIAVHYKFTVLLVPNGTSRITGKVIDAAAFPTEKKCEDAEILNVLKYA
jgi:methionine aminopeptidase